MFIPIVVFAADSNCPVIRVIRKDGNTLYCASDVAKAFGFRDPHSAISYHCPHTIKCSVPHPQSPVRSIEMCFLDCSDVLRLAAASKRKGAMHMAKCLTDCPHLDEPEMHEARNPQDDATETELNRLLDILIEDLLKQVGE